MLIRSDLQKPHLVLPDFFIVDLTPGLQTHIYWSIRIPSSRVIPKEDYKNMLTTILSKDPNMKLTLQILGPQYTARLGCCASAQ